MNGIEISIEPRKHDLGGFSVGRVLPFAKRRMVGPFIFFDEIGPAQFSPGDGVDVRPHPHIGLATVTYLFEGEMRHKDSLGFDQVIRPGDVNWMTAGRGIVHSERSDDEVRAAGQRMHGIQSWIALPADQQDVDPSFHHHPKHTMPLIEQEGVTMQLIAGEAFGQISPVATYSPIFYLGVEAQAGAKIPLPQNYEDRAIYGVQGELSVNGTAVGPQIMLVFEKDAQPTITALEPCRLMLLGGASLGPRHIWWNLVSTSNERIEQAKSDWIESIDRGFRESFFSLPPGETEFIPLPIK